MTDNLSPALQQLQDTLEYMPMFVMHKGEMVRVTLENYEEVTGQKLPK